MSRAKQTGGVLLERQI